MSTAVSRAVLGRVSPSLRTVRRNTVRATAARTRTVMSAAPSAPPTYLLLTLDYVEDILEKRDPYRADHLAGAKAQHDAGKCVMGEFGHICSGIMLRNEVLW